MSEQKINCGKCGADLRDKFSRIGDLGTYTCCEGGAVIGPAYRSNLVFSGGPPIAPVTHGLHKIVYRDVQGNVTEYTPTSASGE